MAVMDYSLVQRIIDGTGQILDTTPGSPDSGSYVTEAQLRDWIKAGILFSGYYYNGNFYSDSGHTSPLAKVEGALYVDKTNSNKALYVCLSSTYQSLTEEAQVQAIIDGLNDGTIVPLKAKQDQNGNVIDTTYETKADASTLKSAIENTTIWDIDQQSEVTFEGDGAGTWEIMERQIPTENNDGIFLCMDSSAPSSSSSAGLKGQFYMDANYLYLCIANNTWRRVALSTF